MELLPDLKTLSDSELRDLIQQLVDEENEVSYQIGRASCRERVL